MTACGNHEFAGSFYALPTLNFLLQVLTVPNYVRLCSELMKVSRSLEVIPI